MATPSITSKPETIEHLRVAKELFIDDFRIHGRRNMEKAKAIEDRVSALVPNSDGRVLAQALFELASMQRLQSRFETAIATFHRAAVAAKETRDSETEFSAWLGIARSHAYGTRNHGAAATAFEAAVASAGDAPSRQQRYEIADYCAQLQAGRGELESALVNALQAVNLARDDRDRFYAFQDTGDVLQKFAESCDYRKLVDAKTNSETDPWGACKRAVAAAKSYYERARSAAHQLGWTFLEQESQRSMDQLDTRLFLISNNERFEENSVGTGIFDALDLEQVVANESFSSGGSGMTAGFPVGDLIEEVTSKAQLHDPRSIYLRGIKADLDNNPPLALELYQKAASLLAAERASLLDLRQRGTVVENRTELIRDLGLRLLALQKRDEAFVVFESLRSHGLEWLYTAFRNNNFTDPERKWIATQIRLDSLISAKQNQLVETAIAGIEHSRSGEMVDELDQLQLQRRELQKDNVCRSILKRLEATECQVPPLKELKKMVDRANIPVLLYWVTPVNVVVWVVSPQEVAVKTVFLPEPALVEKVGKLRNTVNSANQPFALQAAKELHSYLIKPFAKYLTGNQLLIIPQGPLVGLPFEALVDAEDGSFVAEKLSVSYAPNAAFAMRSFAARLPEVSTIDAIYDAEIEKVTHEISRISNLSGVQVNALNCKGMSPSQVVEMPTKGHLLHVLLHGEYNYDDPLQSTVKIGAGVNPKGRFLTAAELLAADWRQTPLAVFSSCEGALVKTRISNEQLGISWALLAGGVEQVMLSRWRVNAASNAVWMETFYRHLITERLSPALAANAAMREMIGSGKQHPYYWAGPQVFGR